MHVILKIFFSNHLFTEFEKETTTKDTTAALQSVKPTLVLPYRSNLPLDYGQCQVDSTAKKACAPAH